MNRHPLWVGIEFRMHTHMYMYVRAFLFPLSVLKSLIKKVLIILLTLQISLTRSTKHYACKC